MPIMLGKRLMRINFECSTVRIHHNNTNSEPLEWKIANPMNTENHYISFRDFKQFLLFFVQSIASGLSLAFDMTKDNSKLLSALKLIAKSVMEQHFLFFCVFSNRVLFVCIHDCCCEWHHSQSFWKTISKIEGPNTKAIQSNGQVKKQSIGPQATPSFRKKALGTHARFQTISLQNDDENTYRQFSGSQGLVEILYAMRLWTFDIWEPSNWQLWSIYCLIKATILSLRSDAGRFRRERGWKRDLDTIDRRGTQDNINTNQRNSKI